MALGPKFFYNIVQIERLVALLYHLSARSVDGRKIEILNSMIFAFEFCA